MNDDNAVITNNYPVYHPVVSAHGKAHVILETGLSNKLPNPFVSGQLSKILYYQNKPIRILIEHSYASPK